MRILFVVVFNHLFVTLELAIHLVHGFLDGAQEVMLAGLAEVIEVIPGHVQMGHVFIILVADRPMRVKLALEIAFQLGCFVLKKFFDLAPFGMGVLQHKFHLHIQPLLGFSF
jgi:hypothetical protein